MVLATRDSNRDCSFEFDIENQKLNQQKKKVLKVDESINKSNISDGDDKPYKETIDELQKLIWESSPLAKVELVYNALKYTLAEEVDNFWEGYDRFTKQNDRNIDIDNLQGITIYIVWAMQRPTVIVDCFLTSEFLSRTTKISTRSMFLKVLQSSIDFLLEM